MFTDAEFMTAREKQLVLNNWKTFLKYGLKNEHFTKRLYQHLHLHCGYIAHYNIQGFYSTYFEAGQDTEQFFEHFCDAAADHGANDYRDLNAAMLAVYQEFKPKIMRAAENNIHNRLDIIEACVKQAREDDHFARQFLMKIRM